MPEPSWKALVEKIAADQDEPPHLDRIREHVGTHASAQGIKQEILLEIASSLGRAQGKVEQAIDELGRLNRVIDASEGRTERNRAVEAFNAQRESAKAALAEFCIHREAVGLRHHEAVERMHPIPAQRHA